MELDEKFKKDLEEIKNKLNLHQLSDEFKENLIEKLDKYYKEV